MNKEFLMLLLIASLLIATESNWSFPSKILVIISSIFLMSKAISGLIKEIKEDELKTDKG